MSYYKLLEVPQSASLDDIRAAYKDLVLQAHPDKGGSAQMFKRLQDAYEILRDPAKRGDYDEKLKTLAAAKRFAKSASYPTALAAVKNPVTFQLMNGDLYVFETSADKMKCRFRSGDVVTNKKEQSGCIIGAASNGVYWRKDGDAFASLLFNPGGFGGDDNISMLFKADSSSGLGSTLGGSCSYSGFYSPRMTTTPVQTSLGTPSTPTRSTRVTQPLATDSVSTPRGTSAAPPRTGPTTEKTADANQSSAQHQSVRTTFSSRTTGHSSGTTATTARSSSRGATTQPSVATPRTSVRPTSAVTPNRTGARSPSASVAPRVATCSVSSRHADPMASSSHSEVSARSSQRAPTSRSGSVSASATSHKDIATKLSPAAQQRRDLLKAARLTQITNSMRTTQTIETDKRREINRDVDEHFHAFFSGIAAWVKRPNSVHPRTCVPHSSSLKCFTSVDKLSSLRPGEVGRTASRSSSANSVSPATARRSATGTTDFGSGQATSLTPNRTSRLASGAPLSRTASTSSKATTATAAASTRARSRTPNSTVASSSAVIGTPRRTTTAVSTTGALATARTTEIRDKAPLVRTNTSQPTSRPKSEVTSLSAKHVDPSTNSGRSPDSNQVSCPDGQATPGPQLNSPPPSGHSDRILVLREARALFSVKQKNDKQQHECSSVAAPAAELLPFPSAAHTPPSTPMPKHDAKRDVPSTHAANEGSVPEEDDELFLTADDITRHYPRAADAKSSVAPLLRMPADTADNISEPAASSVETSAPKPSFTLRLPKPASDMSSAPTPRGYRSISLSAPALKSTITAAPPPPQLTPRLA